MTGRPRYPAPAARRRARTEAATVILLAAVAVAIAGIACATSEAQPRRALRICADPNNLPFSNERQEGFENRIAEMLAEELDARLEYAWWAQRRGFIRNSLRAGECDVVMGVPSSFELALPTSPYYRSTYVFVYRADRGLTIRSMDDSVLRTLLVGVHVVGDDYTNTPPAHALGARGIVGNVRGYSMYDDYSQPNPPARLIEAVARGDVDVAIAWGPTAGYFAPRQDVPLELVPVSPQIDLPFLPFVFDIALGVRRGEDSLKAELERALANRRPQIDSILDAYGVPVLQRGGRRR